MNFSYVMPVKTCAHYINKPTYVHAAINEDVDDSNLYTIGVVQQSFTNGLKVGLGVTGTLAFFTWLFFRK